MTRAQISENSSIKNFVLAGNATFTLAGKQARYTFRVRKADSDGLWFVSTLTGPDNRRDYTYVGIITENNGFKLTKKSRFTAESPQFVAFRWFYLRLLSGGSLSPMEFWHEGRCGKCGRVLTVPESIASGIGPICQGSL